MKHFLLTLILIAPLVVHGAPKCNLESLTQGCQFLRGLDASDVLEFPNGQRTPACALASVKDVSNDKFAAAREAYQAALERVLGRCNPPLSEEYVHSLINGNELSLLNLKTSSTQYWPLDVKSEQQNRKKVSPEDIQDFWKNRLGEDGVKELTLTYNAQEDFIRDHFKSEMVLQKFNMSGQSAREKVLFDRAQGLVITDLLNGRKESELSPAERDILRRVRNLKLRESNDADMPDDCGPAYLAFFDYKVNEVGFPPSLMFSNDQSLIRAMIHEISHSFDLCRLSGGQNGDVTGDDRTKPINGFPQAFPDLGLDSTPFATVHQCLLSAKGGGYDQKGLRDDGMGPSTKGYICYFNQQHEAFADWNAARIIGGNQKILAVKPVGPTPTSNATPSKVVKVPPGLDVLFLQMDLACSEESPKTHFEEDHPSWTDRLDNIMLREPGIAARIGCESSTGEPCQLSRGKGGKLNGKSNSIK